MANNDAGLDTSTTPTRQTWGMAIERWWLEPWETGKATMGLLTLAAYIFSTGH